MTHHEFSDEAAKLERGLLLARGLELSLPPRIDPCTISMESKLAFNALCIREVLLYRVSELGNAALDCYKQKRFVAAGILGRSLMESVSFEYWLHQKIKTAVGNGSTGGIKDFLKKVLIGSRNGSSPYEAYNVLTAIDIASKTIPGYRKLYDELSEVAHPNYSGALGAYAKLNKNKVWYELDTCRLPWPMILIPVVTALELFVHFYDAMIPPLQQFAKLCERELKAPDGQDGDS